MATPESSKKFVVSDIFKAFRLLNEKETFKVVRSTIEEDSVFHGTNLWILFFAILLASLGLNINSTAVIIGAMLISPLMGPIVGLGFGVAINDLSLIKKAFRNYLFAFVVGLLASTIYFLLTPMNDAHSEILSRTLPTTYDVLIALFGGFAGIIAISSKHKGNVIPGVAIATALLPPLCTAGYGLATAHWPYFFGAIYLYLINSVFIATATLITVYLLKFPKKKYDDLVLEKRENRIVWTIIIATLLPSIYLGYDIVRQHEFTGRAKEFINAEAIFPNNYLLNQQIDPKLKRITLVFGGEEITEKEIIYLKEKLHYYKLENCSLDVKKGFSFLKDNKSDEKVQQLGAALSNNEKERSKLQATLDSISNQKLLRQQVYSELKAQYPHLKEAIIESVVVNSDSLQNQGHTLLVVLDLSAKVEQDEIEKMENWLKVRMNADNVRIIIQEHLEKKEKKK